MLRRADVSGSARVRKLVEAIRKADPGTPLIADTGIHRLAEPAPEAEPKPRRRRHLIWLAPVMAAAAAITVGFTALESKTERVSGSITTPTVWTGDKTYVLEGPVFVENTTLTIEPGTTILGENGSALIVTRDSQLFSRGRPDQPVVFTSARAVGERKRGDWGGVVLLGSAPVNDPSPHVEGIPESDLRGAYGGDNPSDSCGVVEYTRIEFAGYEISRDNELNGLTLGGCGHGTIVRHVQVHRALDDGIEMFGGTVDLKYILITGAADDSIDWDLGWTGRVQFAIIQQHPDVGDNAFEGDNNGDRHNATPRSEPVFYNVTLAGSGHTAKAHRGMVLREGTGGHFHNMLIDSYAIEAIDTRDDVRPLVASGQLTFSHSIIATTDALTGRGPGTEEDDDFRFDEVAWLKNADNHNILRLTSVLHPAARHLTEPDFRPRLSSQDMPGIAPPKSEFFDESATFMGAINPVNPGTWLEGWTAFPES